MSISRDLGPSAVPPEADLRFYHTSWAVLLGAAHYSDRKIASLEGVTADLQEVEQVLIGHGFAESNIFKRYDSEVTRAEVLRLLQEELPGQVGPEDRVIFYFGGHGEVVGDEGYLVPYDGVKSAISRSCLSMKELYALGRSLEARHVLFVADACYSGHLVPRSQRETTKAHGPLEAIQPRLAEWSIEIIASSMRKQKAFERDVRGVFTGQFVRALRGEAFTRDFLFALDLASWIGGQVIDSTRSRKNLQLVEYAKEGEGSFVFLRPETRSRHRSEAILTELVSRGRFEVSLWDPQTGRARRAGQEFHLHARSARTGYLYLLSVDPGPNLQLLTPNFDSPECKIQGGTPTTLPTPHRRQGKIRLDRSGIDDYYALVTSEPLHGLACGSGATSETSPFRTWPWPAAADVLESVRQQMAERSLTWGGTQFRIYVD